jgi:tRNA-splicing ligase RtcB
MQIAQLDRYRWQVPCSGRMRVPATVFASETMMAGTDQRDPIGQLVNVACLPGVVGSVLAMPDMHWG